MRRLGLFLVFLAAARVRAQPIEVVPVLPPSIELPAAAAAAPISPMAASALAPPAALSPDAVAPALPAAPAAAAAAASPSRLRSIAQRLFTRTPPPRPEPPGEAAVRRNLERGLAEVSAAFDGGRAQEGLDLADAYFTGPRAAAWFAQNPRHAEPRARALERLRRAELSMMADYRSALERSRLPRLQAEARAAAESGAALGGAWRETELQCPGSGHCAVRALFNALRAGTLARPRGSAEDFIAAARRLLDRPADPRAAAALAPLGLTPPRLSVDDGLDPAALSRLAASLGLKVESSPAPRGDAGWSALFMPGRENLLSMRLFHPAHPLSPAERRAYGRDYRLLHHETYLLGAFDSRLAGRRLYLVQDSGSGATLMATAEELSALTREVDALSSAKPR